jgi:hypothetical protein
LRPEKFSVWLWQLGQSSRRFSRRLSWRSRDVVQAERQRLTEPVGDAAGVAPSRLQPEAEQPRLDVAAVAPAEKQLLDRHGLRARADVAAPPDVLPRLAGEAEAALALRDAVPCVVIRLDLGPVVAAHEARVRRDAKAAQVVGHRRP